MKQDGQKRRDGHSRLALPGQLRRPREYLIRESRTAPHCPAMVTVTACTAHAGCTRALQAQQATRTTMYAVWRVYLLANGLA